MDSLKIEATASTPMVKFEPLKGIIEIKGSSISENAVTFYKPLLAAVKKYSLNPAANTLVEIHLTYCNTSSSRCILELLKLLEGLTPKGHSVQVNWYYSAGDEHIRDDGLDFKSIINLEINIQQR